MARGYIPHKPYQRHKPEAWAEAVKELARGNGYGAASRASGISTKTLAKHYPGWGRPTGNAHSDATRDRARELLLDGVSYREVQATLGVSRHAVAEWFPNMGWTLEEGGRLRKLLLDNSTLTRDKKMWDMNRAHKSVRG